MRPLSSTASIRFLEALVEEPASGSSTGMPPPRSVQSHGHARVLPESWARLRAESTALSASLIPEEPHHDSTASMYGGSSTQVVSQAIGSSYGALSLRDGSGAGGPPLPGPPSAPASSSGASQHDNPFLEHAGSQPDCAAPARSIFSGSAGTARDHQAPCSLAERVADVMSSLSSAASTSHRPSHGMAGPSTAGSVNSLHAPLACLWKVLHHQTFGHCHRLC